MLEFRTSKPGYRKANSNRKRLEMNIYALNDQFFALYFSLKALTAI